MQSIDFGQAVRMLRNNLHLTQEEFAHELGITVGTVSRWEKGRFKPSRLARATMREYAERHGQSFGTVTTAPAPAPLALAC